MTWYWLDSVPKDGTTVLFWVANSSDSPNLDGYAISGRYDAVLDVYQSAQGDEVNAIAWAPLTELTDIGQIHDRETD
jgi:hypothetical protein